MLSKRRCLRKLLFRRKPRWGVDRREKLLSLETVTSRRGDRDCDIMLFEGVQLTGLVLVRDSWRCDGTGILLWAVQQLQSPAVFLSLAHNPAHYISIFRKAAGRLSFIQGDSAWASQVAEEMMNPVATWSEDAERCELSPEALIAAAQGISGNVAIVDDLTPLFYALDSDAGACLRFVNQLRCHFPCVVLRVPTDLPPSLSVLELGCSAVIEATPLSTGFSRSVHGQVRVRTRANLVLRETANTFYRTGDSGLAPAALF